MKEVTIKNIGSLLRVAQVHRLHNLFSPENNIRITCTHHVNQRDLGNFEVIIDYFMKTRKIISPQEFFTFWKKPSFKGKLLLLTFDDGLLSSYYAAKQILSKYQIKAVFFIPTKILELQTKNEMRHFMAKNVYFNTRSADSFREDEYLTMNREHILDLHNAGHMILPHTHTHRRLNDIHDQEEAIAEIIKPKNILESLLGCKVNGFAFPVGTEREVSSFSYAGIKQNYQFCFTNLAGINTLKTDKYFLHRDCIHAHYNLNQVRNILDGVYDMFYLYKMANLRRFL